MYWAPSSAQVSGQLSLPDARRTIVSGADHVTDRIARLGGYGARDSETASCTDAASGLVCALTDALARPPGDITAPTAVIAHTIKGKGISFMEDDNNWHYRVPTDAEVIQAKGELGLL